MSLWHESVLCFTFTFGGQVAVMGAYVSSVYPVKIFAYLSARVNIIVEVKMTVYRLGVRCKSSVVILSYLRSNYVQLSNQYLYCDIFRR